LNRADPITAGPHLRLVWPQVAGRRASMTTMDSPQAVQVGEFGPVGLAAGLPVATSHLLGRLLLPSQWRSLRSQPDRRPVLDGRGCAP
jgi:hypothetical protein